MKRKTYRVCDFKRWLTRHDTETFGTDECDCPLSRWLGVDMTLTELDKLPAWANRFVGKWDAEENERLYSQSEQALEVLEHITP